MSDKGLVEIIHTYDENDCETCGGSYCESYQIKHGDKVYGLEAAAGCFGSSSTDLADVLVEFLKEQGYAASFTEGKSGD